MNWGARSTALDSNALPKRYPVNGNGCESGGSRNPGFSKFSRLAVIAI
jgi:hypothetical protein